VRNSLVQSTIVVEHDPKLNYLDPRLLITTHKTKSQLHQQLKASLRTKPLQELLRSKITFSNDPEQAAELKRLQIA
jgi:hypothetical protein